MARAGGQFLQFVDADDYLPSDATEQLIILGAGALRVSSQAFRKEVQEAEEEIRRVLSSQ